MKTHIYFTPGYSSYEEISEAFGPIYDASSLSKIADCPRSHEIRIEDRLTEPGTSAPMVAGIAIHQGLESYYASNDRSAEAKERSIEIMREEWKRFKVDPAEVPQKHAHLTEEHLAGIMPKYYHEWEVRRIEIFTPVSGITLDSLRLDNVLAAKFHLDNNDNLILGESSLVMEFEVAGEKLVLAGKPDLPVRDQSGRLFTMDHKSTSQSLSDYWAKTHEVSNKDRGYMAMLRSLFGETPAGSIINGIYVGKYALNPKSKAVKFERFKFDFSPDHIDEALHNQLAWVKTIEFYRDTLKYFPQGCGYGGCSHPALCRRDPATRDLVKQDPTRYVINTREFWEL